MTCKVETEHTTAEPTLSKQKTEHIDTKPLVR